MSTVPLARLLGFLMVATLIGCASDTKLTSSSQSELSQARERLITDIQSCSEKHGYNPSAQTDIGARGLAPGELQWRQCVYDAVRLYGRANPSLKGMYEQLIAEDIAMTTGVQQGALTRAERQTRIEQVTAQIRQAEEEQVKTTAGEQQRRIDQVRQMVDGVRAFAR